MIYKIILVLLLLVNPSLAYRWFRLRIPNGENVPHPCKANHIWNAVGHINPDGGGPRNHFGADFRNAKMTWTSELCQHDSDGDGMTNGEELGDPNCVWTKGSVPERVTDITHPGICTPFNEGICEEKDLDIDCDHDVFGESCDVIKDPNVDTGDLMFKEHTIPNTETNYYCQYFDLPLEQDLHIVAVEGIIDNREVLHHMVIYSCPDWYESSPKDNEPNSCTMGAGDETCRNFISGWTVGLPGICFGDNKGFRIGVNGFKKVKLEIHYNNPKLESNLTDKSGMRLYTRPSQEGVHDLTTFIVGQRWLVIPPGKQRVEFQGSCSSNCTNYLMTKPVNVTLFLHHMHYMGRGQKTEVFRDGQLIKVLADDVHYNYDSPIIHLLEESYQILPGDEVVTTCSYNSMSRNQTVFYGQATSDEMCVAFMTVHPADAFPITSWCVDLGPLSECDRNLNTPKYGCDWARFLNLQDPEMAEYYDNLKNKCNVIGTCRPECRKYIDKNLKDHPCLQTYMKPIVTLMLGESSDGIRFLALLHSCPDDDVDVASLPVPQTAFTLLMIVVAIVTIAVQYV